MQVMLDGSVGEVEGLEKKVKQCAQAGIKKLMIPASHSTTFKRTADFDFIGVGTVIAAMGRAINLFQKDGKC
jgi:predicted S18 family serine protease